MEKIENKMERTEITEADSFYDNLETMGTSELLTAINIEDKKVPEAVERAIPQVMTLVDLIVGKMRDGGRLFYIGAGTSGRLGVVDASECPPTFGVPQGTVIGLIAGGDKAIRETVEFAEDDIEQGWKDLSEHQITDKDIVIGIAASGNTPYVVAALEACNKNNIVTACITCNQESNAARVATYSIEVIVGPEFITGSTRMKSGTAQKLVLNMISTSVMVKLGKVMGNKMLDMKLSNNKLIDRGTQMVVEKTRLPYEEARAFLLTHGSVREALNNYGKPEAGGTEVT